MISKQQRCSLILKFYFYNGDIPVLIYRNKHTNSQANGPIARNIVLVVSAMVFLYGFYKGSLC